MLIRIIAKILLNDVGTEEWYSSKMTRCCLKGPLRFRRRVLIKKPFFDEQLRILLRRLINNHEKCKKCAFVVFV